jgi:1,4-alpha-glucan branching enzyme
MKKIIPFLLFIITYSASYGQVTVSPPNFDVDEEITVTVDINSTDTDCNGISNPSAVYMHAGAGNNSNAFGFDVVGNWGQDDGVGEMTSIGGGLYSITFTPSTYFNLTQQEINSVTQLGIVFRNEDGTQELKDNGCNDFFLPVGRVIINFINPTEEFVLVNPGSDLNVSASITYQGSTTVQGSFEIFYNDVSVDTGTCGFPTCAGVIPNITESGEVRFVGTPPGATETGEASFQVQVIPNVTEQALPSNLENGINYSSDDTKATLVLHAPGKDFVQVAGSFNNYQPTDADVMKRDPNTGKFWLEITGLTPGQIETYQYWVYDATPLANSPTLIKVADPYSTLVLNEFDDPNIPNTTYPNMPQFPAGADFEVTVLQTGQTPYNWQVTNFQKPKIEDMVLYEVLVRDFDADRNYQDLIDKIDYFKNLNINAIHLMPVMEYDSSLGWGYDTTYHMALDKVYGTENKLKEFIDLCHQNGIAVILDLVMNHAFGRSPLVRMWMDDPDGDGFGGVTSENPYFNVQPTHSYNVGSDFNHQQPHVQDYTKRVIKHWIEEFKIDGFRWDLTKGFTQNCSGGDEACTNAYQQDRVDLLKNYADYSWSLDDSHIVIFEHLGSDAEEQQWANYRINEGKGISLWGKMTNEYNELTMGQGGNKNINRMGHNSRGFNAPRLLGYPESHDEERLMYNNLQFGASNGNYNVQNLNTALSRMSALGAVSVLVPGPKMIWHFGDLGMDLSIFTCNNGNVNLPGDQGGPGDCKLDTKPQPQWTENWLTDAIRSQIYEDWSKMHKLKTDEPVFEGNYTIDSGDYTPRIDIWDDSLPNNELKNVIILANFNVVQENINTFFPAGISNTWYDLMDPTGNTTFSDSQVQVTLQPGQFLILGNKPSQVLSIEDNVKSNFSLYPNPSRGFFNLTLDKFYSLEVYDLNGRQVKLFEGEFTKNDSFNISDLNSGMYMIRVKGENDQMMTSKLIKM